MFTLITTYQHTQVCWYVLCPRSSMISSSLIRQFARIGESTDPLFDHSDILENVGMLY